jgi:SAM-dependent methyltransferase
MHSMKLVGESDAKADELARALQTFYQKPDHYTAFESMSDHPGPWRFVADTIERLAKQGQPVRVLEAGCGRTGFCRYLSALGLRSKVIFVAHDVTTASEDYLRQEADEVVVGPLENLSGRFDVIFSTYVWEHLTTPARALQRWLEQLTDDGSLLIFSPRYDLPGYLSPSADHETWDVRAILGFQVMFYRLKTLLTGVPVFVLDTDPAVFHLPWRTDRDAVHWVSLFDLQAVARDSFRIQQLSLPHAPSWRDYVLKRWLTLAVRIDRLAKQ